MYDYEEKLKSKRKHEDAVDDQIMLQNLFGFDADDLATNQAGRLSSRQRARLQKQCSRGLLNGLLIFTGCTLIFILFGAMYAVNEFEASGGMMFLAAMIAIVWGGSTLRTAWREHRDLMGNRVHSREEYIRLDILKQRNRESRTTRNIYIVMVGDQRFYLTQQGFLAFKSDEPYIICYLPHTQRIVSARWVRGEAFR